MAPVKLDLRRDLPKVREQFPQILKAQVTYSCDYTAPCVVGAMVPPDRREELQNGIRGDSTIGKLIAGGLVAVPIGQRRDFTDLQKAFDSGERSRLESKLERLEAKYLESASA